MVNQDLEAATTLLRRNLEVEVVVDTAMPFKAQMWEQKAFVVAFASLLAQANILLMHHKTLMKEYLLLLALGLGLFLLVSLLFQLPALLVVVVHPEMIPLHVVAEVGGCAITTT